MKCADCGFEGQSGRASTRTCSWCCPSWGSPFPRTHRLNRATLLADAEAANNPAFGVPRFEVTADEAEGHFLIDRDGVVRWAHLEARERVGDVAAFPSEEDLLRAAAALPR